MAVPGGKEVGKVTIRVTPDTDQFFAELKAALEEAEKLTCTIKVRADTTGFRDEVRDAARGLSVDVDVDAQTAGLREEVEASLEGLDAVVDLDADPDDFRKTVEKAAKDTKAKVKVDADTGKAEAKLDRWQYRYLNKVEQLLNDIDVAANLTPEGEINRQVFAEQAKELQKQIKAIDLKADAADIADLRFDIDEMYRKIRTEAAKTDLITKNKVSDTKRVLKRLENLALVSAEIDKDGLLASWADIEAWAATLDLGFKMHPEMDVRTILRDGRLLRETLRGAIKVGVDVDTSRADRALARIVQRTSQVSQSLGAATGAIGANIRLMGSAVGIAAKGFAALGPQVIALTALIAALLPPVLALGAGLITLAPAALAAVVPFGVIALGLDGIKKAAEAAKPAFDDLKKSVSSVFESGLPGQQGMTAGFKVINDQIIPNIKASLQGVAQSITNSFNAVIGTLASPKGIGNLNNIFNNVAAGIENAKGGLKGFTSGILELVSAISNKFPGLGQWFTNLGDKFAAWVTKFTTVMDKNGETGLERTINNVRTGIEGLTSVFQTFWNQGMKDIQDPSFGQGMKNFFDSVKSFVQNTLPSLSEGFKQIASLLKQMEPLFQGIGLLSNIAGVFTDPGKTISDAVSRFKETGSLKDAFTGVGPGAEKAGQEAAEGLNAGMEAGLEQTKRNVEAALQGPQTVKVGGAEQSGVGMAVSGQVDTAISAARNKLVAFQGEFAGLIAQTLVPLQEIPNKLNGAFTNLGAAFQGAFTALGEIVRSNMTQIADSVALGFQSIPEKLNVAFAGLGGAVAGAMIALKGVIAANLQSVTDAFGQAFAGAAGRVTAAMAGVSAAVSAGMGSAAQAAATGVTGILNVLSAGLQAAPQVVNAIFSAIPGVVQAAMAPAIQSVATVCQQMVSTALSFAGAMESAGRSIGASFAAGIASSGDLVSGAASSLMGLARAFFPNSPAKEGPFSGAGWVDKSGEAVGASFASGIKDSTSGVVSTARELMQAIKDVFGTAEGLTINFNMGGAAQQMTQLSAATTQFQDSLASTAQTATGFKDSISSVSGVGGSAAGASKAELDQQMRQLEMERKSLEIQRLQGTGDQAAIKSRLEEIRLQKLQLGLQQNQLSYAEKYGEQVGSTGGKLDQLYRDIGEKVVGLPKDFLTNTGSAFMQDLGMSGEGMIPQLLSQGSQFIFQVANMDSALSAQQTLQRKQALGVVGR